MSDPATPRLTIADLYEQGVALVSSAMGYPRPKLRSEQTAVRIYELTLMWALNNRTAAPSHDILPADLLAEEGNEDDNGTTTQPTEDAT